ncbi:MAG: carboxypeptidase-like regulatory domain-containing protein [Cyclobacteriaceae bacterium]
MKCCLLFILSFSASFLSYQSYGQRLLESRQSSYFTYIYQITDQEAKTLYMKGSPDEESSLFHTLVDSFPTDSSYTKKLPVGHYLKTFIEENTQKVSITTIQDFEVFILNNNTDLVIQVYDLDGQLQSNAVVRIKRKKLHYDTERKAFIDKKSNRKGLLSVTVGNFTAYYNLSRQHNNSFIKRGSRTLLYQTPLKYVWIPVNFILHIPYDGVVSIVRRWPRGTIYRIKNFFTNSFYWAACHFDHYYCDMNNRFEEKHSGYLVFNKAKYLPGDTVKFKAFIVNKKGKPINKDLVVELWANRKSHELAQLSPYRKGGYSHMFIIHDSLDLKLDQYYTLSLQKPNGKTYISESFKYEDYELSRNKVFLRTSEQSQYKDKEFTVWVEGKDENDLNLLDARVELLFTADIAHDFFDNEVFIPDTLLFLERRLLPEGETEFKISDTTWPAANFEYGLSVRLLTSDNQVVTESTRISYYHLLEEARINIEGDSLEVSTFKNGHSDTTRISVFAEDNFGNKNLIYLGNAPWKVKINPFYAFYTVKTDSLQKRLDLSGEPSLIQCYSQRTSDSLFVLVENPRGIPFNYSIYKQNALRETGHGKALEIAEKVSTSQNFFLSLNYLWGGEIHEKSFRIPLQANQLNLEVRQPKLVYPGQKSNIEIHVTDLAGRPVSGVDLTAYSMTKKFNYSPPDLPYLGKQGKDKTLINNFDFKDFDFGFQNGYELDYHTWKLIAGLDSIEYYRFTYPGNRIYRFEYATQDNITQFAPFVVKDGSIQPIHVIYVDRQPVYFSWSTHQRPYAFRVDSGFHQISLRTTTHQYDLDSIYFKAGQKTILSIDVEAINKKVRKEEKPNSLTIGEQNRLYNYIIPYKNNFGEHFAYLKRGPDIQLIKPEPGAGYHNQLAGPLSGQLAFHLMDSFSINFSHEPYSEYEFQEGLLKMRTKERDNYPKYLESIYYHTPSLTDTVRTLNGLKEQWNNYLNAKRHHSTRYYNPSSHSPGYGRLYFSTPPTTQAPLNVLVFRYDDHDFLRVYPGNTNRLYQLEEGYYQLLFFYPDSRYHIEDSIRITPNGLNYHALHKPEILQKDSFSIYVSHLIEETLFKRSYERDSQKELNQIFTKYRQQFSYSGVGETIEGYVYEEGSNEALPGVTIIVQGTNYGTVTDLEGYFRIRIPPGKNILDISFVGFASQEIDVSRQDETNIFLSPDVQQLQEVVVVGYSSVAKKSLSAAVSTLSTDANLFSNSLQGRVAGVSITPGSSGVNITIRGQSTISFEKQPLYIINGNVFSGNIDDLDPEIIKSLQVLKDTEATAIYGSQGANGVVIIETESGKFKPTLQKGKGADYDESFFAAASAASSIRENFSDYAFWEPRLFTDSEGKVSFDVTFPDDITSWDTYFLAMNGKKQTGQTQGLIKSYKPIMGQLATPRFLVSGDTTYAIGKVLNYSPDSINVTTRFEINDQRKFEKEQICKDNLTDSLEIVAGADSLEVKYSLEKEDGYLDGELRDIPVYPLGMEETLGSFFALDSDTVIRPYFNPLLGEVSLYAKSDILEIIEDELNHVLAYRYNCNEQLASKLKALLMQKVIADYREQKFNAEKEINRLIRQLGKNQIENGLWGWWKDSDENLWVSLHVLEALTKANKLGFEAQMDNQEITGQLIWKMTGKVTIDNKIKILKILQLLDAPINYESYLSDIESSKSLTLNQLLQILLIKQKGQLTTNTDTLMHFQRKTLFGNVYYADEQNTKTNNLNNDRANTLLAYHVLKNDSVNHQVLLKSIRNYFFENRRVGHWANTYESAQIVETLLPDILKNQTEPQQPRITLSGSLDQTVTNFPFEIKIAADQPVTITKSGDFPVYLTTYQKSWNSNPKAKQTDFEINTFFKESEDGSLNGGEEVTLVARVRIKEDADYVMINIPIPGGCSYAEKRTHFPFESHREYFKNETAIFSQYLPKGDYTFEIKLIPRFSGIYSLNPAKVELMYFPTFSANNELKNVAIK